MTQYPNQEIVNKSHAQLLLTRHYLITQIDIHRCKINQSHLTTLPNESIDSCSSFLH